MVKVVAADFQFMRLFCVGSGRADSEVGDLESGQQLLVLTSDTLPVSKTVCVLR